MACGAQGLPRRRDELERDDPADFGEPLESRAPADSTPDYASSASLSRMLYGEDLVDWITKHRPHVTSERQIGGPVVFPAPSDPQGRRVTVVRAPMGSGKTTALIEWLKSALRVPDMSALVVSCRRSFTHTLAGRFNDAGLVGFVTYFTSMDYIMRGKPFHRLLVQVESLHRVERELIDRYDVLVLDEVMSTLGQLYSPTMRQLHLVDSLLFRLLRTCPRIIAMDATVNAQLVELLADIRGDENVHVIVGEYASPGFADRSCLIMRKLGTDSLAQATSQAEDAAQSPASQSQSSDSNFYDSSGDSLSSPPPLPPPPPKRPETDTFFYELGRRLTGGLNVCIFSSTVAFSETVAKFCSTFTDSVLILNSTRVQNVDVASWGDYRVVVYTTVVTVGLSFDENHFHSMFAYVKPMTHGPDMVSVYQSLGRVRMLRLNEVFMYVDGSGARSESVFAPMLLNHAVDLRGGWSSIFSQVTSMICCNFRRDCGPTFREVDDMKLFPRLKYKHLFERCTLNSLGDSINIIHALLESNRIDVRFSGCGATLDAKTFCDLLRDLRRDSLASQREMRVLRKTAAVPISVEACVADSDEVASFVQKYLKLSSSPEEISDLLRKMADPMTRENFINLTTLEACRRIPASMYSEIVFRRLYEHYATGSVPSIGAEGELENIVIMRDFNISARWDLFRLSVKVANALNWNPTAVSETDITADRILELIKDDRELITRLLLEVTRCYVIDHSMASKRPVMEVRAALSGAFKREGRPLDEATHAIYLFKVLCEMIFGARIAKSTRTFPGGTKVKNLRKKEIEDLLDQIGIDRTRCTTHKQLYSLLMDNKAAFSRERYKIRSPKWHKLLRSRLDEDYSHEAALEAALADIPAAHWPCEQGLFDYHAI
ncbi:DNA replication origin-binding helicase [Falconid herpesvirus 1]|uniref:Replication origin-binding protein n=2 Tax=Columbid alphaherpesvirus 1 TaxID=93386 RepID=A0A068EVV2_9ALPH|nr:DNA replication origin-binding helicase [Falconid herpesvirus 1]YP_009352913.1 DNA replication origin-binding helicase [Columbid alphaherpesvirus 1]AID52709.1 DNA replication origin-binding helicase [Falconid herpesvirus 1]ARD71330.1 DNA replication origin-binding helicase [Columbid alphaherpesvirus 1]